MEVGERHRCRNLTGASSPTMAFPEWAMRGDGLRANKVWIATLPAGGGREFWIWHGSLYVVDVTVGALIEFGADRVEDGKRDRWRVLANLVEVAPEFLEFGVVTVIQMEAPWGGQVPKPRKAEAPKSKSSKFKPKERRFMW